MTEEEVKALIMAALDEQLPNIIKGSLTEFSNHFEGQLNELSASLDEKLQEQGKNQESETDPTMARVLKLEQELQKAKEYQKQKEEEASQLRFSQSLSTALDAKGNILHKGIVSELLKNRMQNMEEKEGKWLSKDGSTLEEMVESFFSSEEGQHFLPSPMSSGTGTPVNKVNGIGEQKVSLDDMFAQMVY